MTVLVYGNQVGDGPVSVMTFAPIRVMLRLSRGSGASGWRTRMTQKTVA